MHFLNLKSLRWLAGFAQVLGLCACVSGGASSPAPKAFVPAQVAYRIDDHRYFEITPDTDGECTGKVLYFVDTVKNIRSQAVAWDNVMTRGKFIIDAANDQYLIAPVTRGNINRSSGGGGGGDRMPYSTDGGRTWKSVWSPGNTYDLMISESMAYQSWHRPAYGTTSTDGLDLVNGITTTGGMHGPLRHEPRWNSIKNFVFKPRIAPLDNKVYCSAKARKAQQ